ncbi:unnamed protein product [Clonostachys solani]|uniref:NmrA-like domain-containing protein n=1 Tax=Clonostachys solani TaxID=160281 RepID=A0A9N9YZG0_9HYPO|nr:unnamed protein product [Clonostachys solani]
MMASSDSPKKIAVIGGTGNLGSSVAFSLHDNTSFHVRVITRDASGPKAQRIANAGIELAQADAWKPEELATAFAGCWGLFVNIDSDAPNFKQQIGPSELEMGKILLDAAAAAGIGHVIHASLPAATELTNGSVPLVAFDDKAAISKYALQCGKFKTVSILSAGWFLENAFDPKYTASFGGFAMIKDADGYLTWATPRMGNDPESVPFLAAADDYGDFVHGVFLDPEAWNGKYIHGVSESSSFSNMTDIFERVTGKKARYREVESLQAPDKFKTKEVNGLFDLMHAIKGNFFNGIPTQHEDAKKLKAAASQARGKSSEAVEPLTLEGFFRKYAM